MTGAELVKGMNEECARDCRNHLRTSLLRCFVKYFDGDKEGKVWAKIWRVLSGGAVRKFVIFNLFSKQRHT